MNIKNIIIIQINFAVADATYWNTHNILAGISCSASVYFTQTLLYVYIPSLEQVVSLDAQNIVAVSCGEAHTLALNDKGQVFAWGLGSDGQLGLSNFEDCIRIPR